MIARLLIVVIMMSAAVFTAGCTVNTAVLTAPSPAPPELYVANEFLNSVTVYAVGRRALVRTITDGVRAPEAFAFDAEQNLYVANSGGGPRSIPSSITVYARGSHTPIRTLTYPIDLPDSLAFDHHGNLYVSNSGLLRYPSSISVYPPGATTPTKVITDVVDPSAIALGPDNTLYALEFTKQHLGRGRIAVFPPGRTNHPRIIKRGVDYPTALTVDREGNLYVANANSSDVVVYAPGSSVPLRTITDGVAAPAALAFDAEGYLYVANDVVASVTVYSPSVNKLVRTITAGLTGPYDLALDPSGNLYVEDNGRCVCIRAYRHGMTAIWYTVRGGISAVAIAIGP